MTGLPELKHIYLGHNQIVGTHEDMRCFGARPDGRPTEIEGIDLSHNLIAWHPSDIGGSRQRAAKGIDLPH